MLHPDAARHPLLGWGRDAGPGPGAPSARLAWLALVLGTALALWLHNLGVFLLLVLGLGFLVWLGRDVRWSRLVLTNSALAGAAVLMIWSPQLPWLVAQTGMVAEDWWLSFPTPATLLRVASALFGVGYRIDVARFVAGLVVAVVGLLAIAKRVSPSVALLLTLGMVLPVGLSLLLSWLFMPIFHERPLVWVSIPFYLALASALLFLPGTALRVSVLALAAFVSLRGTEEYDRRYKKEPWDRIVRTIGREIRPGGVVLVMPPYTLPMMQYYIDKTGIRLPIVPVPIPPVPFDQERRLAPETILSSARVTPEQFEQVRPHLDGPEDVWLVCRRSVDIAESNDRVLEYLRAIRPELRAEALSARTLWLYRFGPPAAASGKGAG